MTMSSNDRAAQQAASRFASRLGAAREAAVIGASPVSAWVSASGYGFERYSGGQWQSVEEKPLVGADWSDGVQVTSLGGSRVRIRFDALGMTGEPVSVALAGESGEAEVRVDANGDITVR
jgi:general secretion pathway protein H